MTFNQWCAGKDLSASLKATFQAVWLEMSDVTAPATIAKLLTDLHDCIERETREEDW